MKTLILILSILASSAYAQEFNKCEKGDMNLLSIASTRNNPKMQQLVKERIIPEIETCEISKPRYIHPAVCGANISQVDTFKIKTVNQALYTITVDSSYRSCYRHIVLPRLTKLTYELSK